MIGARGGGSGTWSCGGGDGGGRSHSSIFLEQPLEGEFTPSFLQMMARVCVCVGGGGGGGVPSPLIEFKMGQEGKGPT